MRWKSLVALVAIVLPIVFLAGCASDKKLAHATRTGKIHDIKVGESLNPPKLEVRVGDEIRWINTRSAPVKIVFVDPMKDRVSCQDGFQFSGFTGMFSDEASNVGETTIEPNEHASLCISSPGSYTYNSRMVATAAGGETNSTGKIWVDRME
ncbi:MAG: hypothetical protein ACT4OO_15600 [Nitrospiraceae bacterium]